MRSFILLVIFSTVFCATALGQWRPLSDGYEYNSDIVSGYPAIVVELRASRSFAVALDCVGSTYRFDVTPRPKAEIEKRLGTALLERFCRVGDEALPKGFYQLAFTGSGFKKFAAWLDTRSRRVDPLGNVHVSWRLIPRYPVPYAFEHEQLDSTAKREAFSHAIIRSTINCSEKFLRGDSVEFYDTSGAMIEEKKNSKAGKYVDAGTFGADLVAEVCKQ